LAVEKIYDTLADVQTHHAFFFSNAFQKINNWPKNVLFFL